ncbi:transcriptional regulator with XRE-family HTH domain [Streptomyces sp. SAI-208]|uniref:helix-turn-helix domain-containing protein n=1 Tax=Streptomyces sp. SAI-208 TaxID=2940550 RepID=UPI0024734D17|nr:helix-turn-helix transcriptional regulator [Streptomyces sp. SAI-208]MDH6610258.1 transcriptional regulator with XRE-family HTH domain [Streptomyces sp. SAI-208]
MPPRLAPDLPVSRIVGVHIHTLRTARGWSLREVARQAEIAGKPIGYATIGRIEGNRAPDHPVVAVTVDDLVTLATVFGVRPERLLAAPDCFVCMDKPPTGFECRTCGATA